MTPYTTSPPPMPPKRGTYSQSTPLEQDAQEEDELALGVSRIMNATTSVGEMAASLASLTPGIDISDEVQAILQLVQSINAKVVTQAPEMNANPSYPYQG